MTGVRTLALPILLLALPPAALAQEPAPAGQQAQAPTEVPPPEPAVQEIPLAEVEAEAVRLTETIRKIDATVEARPETAKIEEQLPEIAASIDDLRDTTRSTLRRTATVESLRALEEKWTKPSTDLEAANKTLSSRVEEIGELTGKLDEAEEVWGLTRTRVGEQEATGPILERIGRAIEEIGAARKRANDRRASVLTLQSQVGEQIARINETRAEIDQAMTKARKNLFEPDAPPLWSTAFRARMQRDMEIGLAGALRDDVEAIRGFAVDRRGRLLLHLLVGLVLIVAMWNVRRKARQRVEAEPGLESALEVFEHPVATGLLLAILLTLFLYPGIPTAVLRLFGVASVVPLLFLLRVFLPRALIPAVYLIAVLFVTNRGIEVGRELPAMTRIVFVFEMVIATSALVFLLRPGRIAAVAPEIAASAPFRLVGTGLRIALGGFLFALLATLAGYSQLGKLLGLALLRSAMTGLLAYALVSVLYGLLLFAVRSRPLRFLGMVVHHRARIESRSRRVLAWLGTGLWVYVALGLFELRDAVFGGVMAVLTASLTIGEASISLGDFVVFGVVLWASFLVSKGLRFVLEEEIYPRTRLQRGIPYALSTLTHYILLTLGFLLAVASTGLDLDRFAILIGALGVGIGFGLQNVVNNFVSGLILLFERPVQIGDAVQVGTLQGRIRRIGIRASVVRTWDGAEVVVPNGSLVSEPLVNSTLSDQQRRLEVAIGVKYGTDPERVIALLLEMAKSHPDILEDPAPVVLFKGFGESSLDFLVRAWTDRWDEGLRIKSDLTVGVNRVLADAGIEIPFPQRDLHLRSVDSSLRGEAGDGGSPSTVEK
jgi:small-conductance mechanosensitive channel